MQGLGDGVPAGPDPNRTSEEFIWTVLRCAEGAALTSRGV